MLVWCAAISGPLPGPGISVPPHGHRQLSSGVKLPTTQTLLLAWRVAELRSRWCELSQAVTAQAGVRPWRGDWSFIRKIIFLIHGWMMYLCQIKQLQAQKQCIRESKNNLGCKRPLNTNLLLSTDPSRSGCSATCWYLNHFPQECEPRLWHRSCPALFSVCRDGDGSYLWAV